MRIVLLYIAIGLMIYLILYSIINMHKGTLIEGLTAEGELDETVAVATTNPTPEYKEPPSLSKDPLYLATLNAANISDLKNKLADVISIRKELNETKDKVENNSIMIRTINAGMKDITTSMVPDQTK